MEQLSLFDDRERSAPFASRLRPSSLEEFAGQEHLVGKGRILRQLIEKESDLLHDFLGAAWCRKDNPCKYHCGENEGGVCQFQCRDKRDQRD